MAELNTCTDILQQCTANIPCQVHSVRPRFLQRCRPTHHDDLASLHVIYCSPAYPESATFFDQHSTVYQSMVMHPLAGMHPFSYPFRSELRSSPQWSGRTAWTNANWQCRVGMAMDDNSLSLFTELACYRLVASVIYHCKHTISLLKAMPFKQHAF